MYINAFYLCVYVFLTKCTGLIAMLPYVPRHLLSQANLSHCKDSYITSCCNQGCPSYTLTAATASLLLYHCQNFGVPFTYATPTPYPTSCSTNPHGGILLHYVMGWHSCVHLLLLLPILTAVPRHVAFHFPTTPGLHQALQRLPTLPPTSPNSAPSFFSNHVTASSGIPS